MHPRQAIETCNLVGKVAGRQISLFPQTLQGLTIALFRSRRPCSFRGEITFVGQMPRERSRVSAGNLSALNRVGL